MDDLIFEEITKDIHIFMNSSEKKDFVINSSKEARVNSQNMVQSLLVSPEAMKLRIGV